MSTTTWHAIRDAYASAIVALTPTLLAGRERTFERCPKRRELKPWALETNNSAVFRKFEFVRRGPQTNAGHLASDEKRVLQRADLTVAYPTDPAFYGKSEIDDLEKAMLADANQLADALFTPGNFRAGQSIQNVVPQEPDRANPGVWFQTISCELVYTVAQDLGF